ncbi:hypothetical protein L2E82_36969 [Cichorium intybus]|uniref:Uncharacterized protein n=1 Tax=Cichorium intybus TaxID=13427 RepID=A0ACB9AE32_CICIN|nr:hypothetical protein L2E82_36969 [Cichorium intybus]
MEIDMKEDRKEKFIAVPSYLPRLFVAPSCLPKFTQVVELIAEMKATLSRKIVQLKESTHKKEQQCMERLNGECSSLRLEIYFLENEAHVMRKELVQRIYLEVRSVKEMMAVNDLMSSGGAGATPGMRCFGGMICISGNLPKDVIKAIKIAQRLRQTF